MGRGPIKVIYDALRVAEKPVKISHLPIPPAGRRERVDLLLMRGLLKEVPHVRKAMSGPPHRTPKNVPFLYQMTPDGLALVRLIERVYDILGWSEKLK